MAYQTVQMQLFVNYKEYQIIIRVTFGYDGRKTRVEENSFKGH